VSSDINIVFVACLPAQGDACFTLPLQTVRCTRLQHHRKLHQIAVDRTDLVKLTRGDTAVKADITKANSPLSASTAEQGQSIITAARDMVEEAGLSS